MIFDWFPDWSGEVAVIIGAGESAALVDIDQARNRCRVVVVNNSFRLAPWADVLYASDRKWWANTPEAFDFAGLKVTSRGSIAGRPCIKVINVRTQDETQGHCLHLQPKGLIGHGGNSGFQAINLPLQFGSRKLVLVGFDLRGEHWHGRHPQPLGNPYPQRLEVWRQRLDDQAGRLRAMKVEVVNASLQSALTAYPKMSLSDALDHFNV